MTPIQIEIKGHGNVPDDAVAVFRERVLALIAAGAAVGFPFRVDFSPAADPIPPVVAAPSTPAAPEAVVLEQSPAPRGRSFTTHESTPRVSVRPEEAP